MATLVLTAVGTAVGGPIGGAIGALVGQQIDGTLFGSGSREGPRLADLSVTTSSYGQPIARHFGKMRTAGTIIWATDLIETKESGGGGKGKPSTTTFSYSVSFAVALSSRAIAGIGRIWADGNLLRGSAGDLKTPGTLRIYNGYGDEPIDPLIGSLQSGSSPAFRDTAYVVFEDLQLGDFGNRIPALTFELFADVGHGVKLKDIVPQALVSNDDNSLSTLQGYSDNGGALGSALSSLSRALPIGSITAENGLALVRLDNSSSQPTPLPEALHSIADQSDGDSEHSKRHRAAASDPEPRAVRYYDPTRDYQPSVQRAIGRAQGSREVMIELPAAIEPNDARNIIGSLARNSRWQRETLVWRVAELDDTLGPSSYVKVPGHVGTWHITTWEWLDRGIELQLERVTPDATLSLAGDSGSPSPPLDLLPSPSQLMAFELPWDGNGNSQDLAFFAAVSSATPNWSGATLYFDNFGALEPLDYQARQRSTFGHLSSDLSPSNSVLFEQSASVEITLAGTELDLQSTTIDRLSTGANRLLVGEEVLQFLVAEPINSTSWRLTGLLRGRGGTEWAAVTSHGSGTPVVLLDETLINLSTAPISPTGATRLAALGFGDSEPVYADLEANGVSRRPLSPVHAMKSVSQTGNWDLCWTRRARGQYRWSDAAEVALVEEKEGYLVGLGPTDAPLASWEVTEPRLSIEAATRSDLIAEFGAQPFWVAQEGTYGFSKPTFIVQLT